ncbi:MAG: HIT domain-containing protein [Rickettsiales bacterium]
MPDYDDVNIFARILRKEIPAKILFENDAALAFDDIAPMAPVHALVIPKGNYVDFGDFTAKATPKEIADFWAAVRLVAEDVLSLRSGGYRIIANTGRDASQEVPHFHVHVLAGKKLGGLLPTGT